MSRNTIYVKGAREHNLKNIDVEIPRDKLVVITGLSGSGKSSLAFDTIYAEGQRRYVESLSAYARQFLGRMEKPDVDYIEGLSPAISIDQKTTSKNPRSTVGTVTEIYDYLRLLYARIGILHCPKCFKEIKQQSIDQITDSVLNIKQTKDSSEQTRIQILAPVVRARKGEYTKIFEEAKKEGFVRVRVDGTIYDISEEIKLNKNRKHNIEIVVDRLVVKPDIRQRLADSLETALKLSEGVVIVDVLGGDELIYSQNYACPDCNISIEEMTPRMFSFNSPFGACPSCAGLGFVMEISEDKVIPNRELSVYDGGILATGWNSSSGSSIASTYFKAIEKEYKTDLSVKIKDLPKEIIDIILYGTKGRRLNLVYEREYGVGNYHAAFEGIINNLMRRYKETQSDYMKSEIENLMETQNCAVCGGARLKKEVLAVTVNDKNIYEISNYSISDCMKFFEGLVLNEKEAIIAHQILKEIQARLGFLMNVGLDYLSLSRGSATLSGGEAQRIRLATQIGSRLMGVLYILDEPSIGLHQRDNAKLLKTLTELRDLGNTLIVVEHDEDTMYAADHIIDIGPEAGINGGHIIAEGNVEEIKANENSITGQYLSGKKVIGIPKNRRTADKFIEIFGAEENNLKNIDVSIPIGVFTAVTGVSGSGKSSLINEILFKAASNILNRSRHNPGKFKSVKLSEKYDGMSIGNCDILKDENELPQRMVLDDYKYLDKVIDIDQSPIGRTPRSNPATYMGLFTDIRELFANTNEAKIKGYKAGRFSFNVKGGRCEACSGDGIIKIEMHFLPDVYVPCEVCKGKKYNRETLEVKYKNKNIYDVLDMTAQEALGFFENIPRIKNKIQVLNDVGLEYIKLGQSSTTLSGGEAQRVKLAAELSKRSTGKTLYILDEPTTGLHTADVHKLIEVLNRLTNSGNTVVIIEHNLDIIKVSDYIIDLGPEGGNKGGYVIATGSPESVAKNPNSYTGEYLKKCL